MSQVKKKRTRGVILTPIGLEKLSVARSELEYKANFGQRYTYEQLGELTNLDIKTVKKIVAGKKGVDKRSLEKFIIALGIQLTTDDYTQPNPTKRQDWGEAVSIDRVFGRADEIETLTTWLIKDRCRLVTLLGMGGIGKTTLSIELARRIGKRFDCVIWKSLRDAPPLDEIIDRLIEFLANGKETPATPQRLGEKITLLIKYLRSTRCLIVLDNAESILDSNRRAGKYRPGYEGYGELLRRVGSTEHLSSLIITSREKPKEIAAMMGEQLPVRSLQLKGLREVAEIFKLKGLVGSESEFNAIGDRYSGNPLALKVVATTILDLFDGNIAEFLRQSNSVFGDIRDILDTQFERLSNIEREIMYWLAIAREPRSLVQLQENFALPISSIKLLEAVESLSRRSLIEKNAAHFTQQPVVMEYVTSHLIEVVCEEIIIQKLEVFRHHALIEATSKDYIRENQIRLILQPIIDELLAFFGSRKAIEACFKEMIVGMQKTFPLEKCYTAGNIINLLCQLETDLTGYDFSNLCVWQADLRQIRLHRVNFQNADLSKSVFAENFGGIWSVAYSPDGQYLATGDTKGNILLRQVKDDRVIRSFVGHNAWVVSLAFSPDGKTLASGSCDCTAKLWNVDTGQCLYSLAEHEHEVWSVVFSPDGNTVATGCDDNKVRLWDVSTGKCLRVFLGHENLVISVIFNCQGTKLFSGSHDNTIKLWDIKTGKCHKTFLGHEDGVRSLSLSPDGKTLASSGNDKSIRLWDLKTSKCRQILRGHDNGVWSIGFSPQGNLLASSSVDRTVRLWDLNTGECCKVFLGHSNIVNSVAFSPTEELLASGSHDQTIKLWNVERARCSKTIQGYNNQILSVVYSPDARMLVSGGLTKKVRLWDLKNKTSNTLYQHDNWIWSVAFSPNRNFIVSGSGDTTVKLWDVRSSRVTNTFTGHQAAVRAIAINADNIIASGSEDTTVKLWNVNTGKLLKTLNGHQSEVWSVAFSSDGRVLASGSLDSTVRLWLVETGECLRVLSGHTDWVFSVAFDPNNRSLASASSEGTIRLWNIDTGECQKVIQEDKGYSQLIVFSSDGRILASCDSEHCIKLWDRHSGECLKILSGHTGLINSLSFAADDRHIVSSSADETMRIWNIENGECVQTLASEKLYQSMNIKAVTGLNTIVLDTLKTLGAVDC